MCRLCIEYNTVFCFSIPKVIYEAVDPNANIIFGALIDESMAGDVSVTVIATGFPSNEKRGRTKRSAALIADENEVAVKPRKQQNSSPMEPEAKIDKDLPSFLSRLKRR